MHRCSTGAGSIEITFVELTEGPSYFYANGVAIASDRPYVSLRAGEAEYALLDSVRIGTTDEFMRDSVYGRDSWGHVDCLRPWRVRWDAGDCGGKCPPTLSGCFEEVTAPMSETTRRMLNGLSEWAAMHGLRCASGGG